MTEEPGNDSGCTAVVALLRGMFQLQLSTYIHVYHALFPRNGQ